MVKLFIKNENIVVTIPVYNHLVFIKSSLSNFDAVGNTEFYHGRKES
jgi:hypothetical protein